MISNSIRRIHEHIYNIKERLINGFNLYESQPIDEDTLKWLLSQARFIFLNDDMLIKTTCPINICGDVHGQYSDLIKIFKKIGFPCRENRYLFLGDYVDRGKQSIETFCLLICFKLLFPNDVFLLRGNHESASVTRMYGFYDECKRRYSIKIWKSFVDVFNCMPIAASIGIYVSEPNVLCMHGGISPSLKSISDIDNIIRPTDIPDVGLICDLLWADPDDEYRQGWNSNDRGVSYVFGRDVLKKFMIENKLDLVVRGHQVVEDGYEFYSDKDLITIFSAPRYCGEFDNLAGILTLDKNLLCKIIVIQ